MRHRSIAAVAAVLATTPCAIAAQTSGDTIRLGEIVVTATKLPLPTGATASAITVLDGDDLRERGVRRVVDALQTVPGVAVAQLGGTGAVASVFMRGGESDYVQLLVDGVQVNDPGGTYDWAHLTTDDVERIEIVRGPVSVLYGSDAVAGVVQIFTRGGGDRTTARAQVLGGRGERVGIDATGSYDALDWNVSAGGSTLLRAATRLLYGASASQLSSDGAYMFNNEYDNRTYSGRLSLQRGRAEIGATARYVDQAFHYPTSGSGELVDRNQLTDGTSLALGINGGAFLTNRVEARLQLASYRSETGGQNPADVEGDGFANSMADVRRNSAELRINTYLPHDIIATVGAEVEKQKGETSFDSDGPFGPFSSASNSERSNNALYAQLLAAPLERISTSIGFRHDDNERFGAHTTGRIGASVKPVSRVRLRGAYGTGFKEPTFLETFATGFAVGDPDLQPERSRSAELGADVAIAGVDFGATYFDQKFRDLIQYTFNAPPGTPNYFNIGEARARGVELTADVAWSAIFALNGEYTHLDSEVIDEGFGEDRAFLEGRPLLRRPEHKASATLRVTPASRFSGSATWIYTGDRDDLDFSSDFSGTRVVLQSHSTFDASASYRLPLRSADVALLLRVTNIFDEEYDEVYNFPSAGRLMWLGASIDINR